MRQISPRTGTGADGSVPPAEDDRARPWEELFAPLLAPVRILVGAPPARPPAAAPLHLGYLSLLDIEAGPMRVQRTPRLISTDPGERVAVIVQQSGTATLTQDGRNTTVEPGNAAFVDPRRPFSLEQREDFRMVLLSLPDPILGLPVSRLRQLTAVVIRREERPASLGIPFLEGLARVARQMPPGAGDRLAGCAVEWVVLLGDAALGEAPDEAGTRVGVRARLLQEVRTYIDRHLGDADLSPERIADAHHISVRYLHRLFEGEGTTVGRLVQRRRIEECGKELARRERASPTISVVARRWGFQDATHFSRAFKQILGVSPRQWRLSLLSGAGSAGPSALALTGESYDLRRDASGGGECQGAPTRRAP
ncbi:helix-turn-helix domain-containing protein [Streptomyces sp. NPDC012421]|uniref:helix-turn-helix domain-containing protein n=1 Tax=Streptomyces sp. NPDC012421 TaxID=3364832 RepID=UPI0036EEE1D1